MSGVLVTREQARAIGQLLDLHHPQGDHVEVRQMSDPILLGGERLPTGLYVKVGSREWGVHVKGWVYGYNDVEKDEESCVDY